MLIVIVAPHLSSQNQTPNETRIKINTNKFGTNRMVFPNHINLYIKINQTNGATKTPHVAYKNTSLPMY